MGDFREELLTTLSNDFIRTKQTQNQYANFLNAVSEYKLFACTKSVSDVIHQVHDCLNSSRARLEGLCLLQRLLLDCSRNVYEQQAVGWAKLLLQILQSYDSPECHRLACVTLCRLLRHARSSAELGREMAQSVLPHLINALLASKAQWKTEALECLCSCMTHFPGPCGPFKNKIENLVLPLMEVNEDSDLIERAVQCFSLLSRCGGGGKLGVRHGEAWAADVRRILATLNITLGLLYNDKHMARDSSDAELGLKLTDVSDVEPAHCYALLSRTDALCRLLGRLLSDDFPVTVQLPLEDILTFLCRVLALSPKMVMLKMTKESLVLASVLPQLHTRAFKLLASLITSAHTHLVTHSSVVNQLLIQTLSWSTTDPVLGQVKLYSQLRSEVYATAATWLQVVATASGIEVVSADLVAHILQDCSPQHDLLKVKHASRRSEPETSSRKRRRAPVADSAQLCGQLQLDTSAHEQTCTAALTALHHLLLTSGCLLKPKLYKSIQELVIPLLVRISAQPQAAPPPYGGSPCRLGLYRVLRDCVLCTSCTWPAPTQCAVVTFSAGQRDPDLQVSSFCSESLAVCESIIHPRAPTFNAPLRAERPLITPSEAPASPQPATGLLPADRPVTTLSDDPATPQPGGSNGTPREMSPGGSGMLPAVGAAVNGVFTPSERETSPAAADETDESEEEEAAGEDVSSSEDSGDATEGDQMDASSAGEAAADRATAATEGGEPSGRETKRRKLSTSETADGDSRDTREDDIQQMLTSFKDTDPDLA